MQVMPVACTKVDINILLQAITAGTGRSPLRGADASGRTLSDYAKFLAALGEFREGGSLDPSKTLRDPKGLLRFLHFGFLVAAPASVIFKICETSRLDLVTQKLDAGRMALVFGTLEVWHRAIIEGSEHAAVREVYNKCYEYFVKFGLEELWIEYRRKMLPDQTYLLEHKK